MDGCCASLLLRLQALQRRMRRAAMQRCVRSEHGEWAGCGLWRRCGVAILLRPHAGKPHSSHGPGGLHRGWGGFWGGWPRPQAGLGKCDGRDCLEIFLRTGYCE